MLSFEKVKNIMDNSCIEVIYAYDISDINSKTVPDHCGAYIITTKSGRRYIGSSVNIYNRIKYHVTNREEQIINVSVYLTDDEIDARNIERYLLYKFRPELNVHKPLTLGKTNTVQIPDDIHLLICKKRIEIIEKYGIYLMISEIIEMVVRHAIDTISDHELFKLVNSSSRLKVKVQEII